MEQASLQVWRKEGRRGIWLRVPISLSHLVPLAVEAGFVFHSADPTSLVMTQWLPTDEDSLMPLGASHTVGVGGFVFRADTKELLVVSEKYSREGLAWKLPGGYVNAGESLGEAAVREVMEETGIMATFQGIISFRHMHPHMFSKSDIYFVALLEPSTFEASPQEAVISAVRWMPVDEYIHHPTVNVINKKIASLFLEAWEHDKKYFVTHDTEVMAWMKQHSFHLLYAAGNINKDK